MVDGKVRLGAGARTAVHTGDATGCGVTEEDHGGSVFIFF